MKRVLGVLIAALLLSSATLATAKDYQVTGAVVDVSDEVIVVQKGTENWEIARDKATKTTGDIKKGDRVTVKYKMTATSIAPREPKKSKSDAKAKTERKAATDSKMPKEATANTEVKTK